MDRRKFMYGFGGTVIGTSAVLGSGAFTSVDVNRTASVNVADDSAAFLTLSVADADAEAGTVNSPLVGLDGNNSVEIVIDGTDGTTTGEGVNDGATLRVGENTDGTNDSPDPVNDADSVAFVIDNEFGEEISLSGSATGTSTEILTLPYATVDGMPSVTGSADDLITTDATVGTGETVHVNVLIDTTAEGFSGSEVEEITLSANPTV